ncbi:MAG TPA: peptide-methionine (R)-S-oxide reductase MsrB [Candidatus Baltobacteraceae bacterium]|jgi:peptide-methionine (R)-S-oxide reductase|nr:peptide-methionine (R)-S-oxide reductase MsrB [Candidatus Baltobacteraceae bacterium]
MTEKITKTDAEWKAGLEPERYVILRKAGTEPAWSGDLLHVDGNGMFTCGACGAELFSTADKYDSGSGWPSFTRPVRRDAVTLIRDASHGMDRVEVRCSRCESHLGHVFQDGPTPTGQRFCTNSLALDFEPAPEPEPKESPK